MRLWLWYVEATEEQIHNACQAAMEMLTKRGVMVSDAYAAVVEANELTEAHTDESTPNAAAVVAWFAAEYLAFETLSQQTGRWPDQGALIVLGDD